MVTECFKVRVVALTAARRMERLRRLRRSLLPRGEWYHGDGVVQEMFDSDILGELFENIPEFADRYVKQIE
jgi:hypothetical protein